MRRGFSLIELSIVLVIIGLLTGGILAGQSLIRAAELRAVSTEFSQYQTAAMTFRDKYFALPGDMPNATDFWGIMSTGTCPDATAGTGTQTCDGNGDGALDPSNAISQFGERFAFWQHLANAGLINGTYTAIAGSSFTYDADVGVNVPTSKISNSGWDVITFDVTSGHGLRFDGQYGNRFLLGRETAADSPNGDIFTPEEMWNIDSKIDDGMPARGVIVVHDRVDCTVKSDNSSISNSVADAALLDAKYALTNSNVICSAFFRNAF